MAQDNSYKNKIDTWKCSICEGSSRGITIKNSNEIVKFETIKKLYGLSKKDLGGLGKVNISKCYSCKAPICIYCVGKKMKEKGITTKEYICQKCKGPFWDGEELIVFMKGIEPPEGKTIKFPTTKKKKSTFAKKSNNTTKKNNYKSISEELLVKFFEIISTSFFLSSLVIVLGFAVLSMASDMKARTIQVRGLPDWLGLFFLGLIVVINGGAAFIHNIVNRSRGKETELSQTQKTIRKVIIIICVLFIWLLFKNLAKNAV